MSHKMTPYEAVVLRYRHDLVSGEFVNFGLAYVEGGEARVLIVDSFERLTSFFSDASESQVRRVADSIKAGLDEVYNSDKGLAIALGEVLTDPSSSVMMSEVMQGIAPSGRDMAAYLLKRYCVESIEVRPVRISVTLNAPLRPVLQNRERLAFPGLSEAAEPGNWGIVP